MKKNKGIFFVFAGASFYGFTPIFVKSGFSNGYTLGQINIVQMSISFLLLWTFTLVKRSSLRGLNKQNTLQIMMTGCFVGLTSIFYYGAMQYLPASIAIILMFQFIWIGIILEWIFQKVKPAPVTVLSIILILIGVFLASNLSTGSIHSLHFVGIIFGILSAFTYAGFIYFSGKVAVEVDPWIRSSLMVTGSAILVTVLFIRDFPSVLPLSQNLLFTGFGVSLFGAILPPLFFAVGAPLISGGVANIITSIELPIALISARLILSETVTPLQWLGVCIILLSIVLNEAGTRIYLRRS
ncbi:EamA family transporter [Mesobacillus jeotgali]|uniref:EamA family transporter n=1 Tax=Mesobacillus jeotgali TaxID=129985 RepID=UPI0009A7D316|nr:DMT family transporter [Mesobacillus jeotgali]